MHKELNILDQSPSKPLLSIKLPIPQEQSQPLSQTLSKSRITEVESEQKLSSTVTNVHSTQKLVQRQSQAQLIERIQTDMRRIQMAESLQLENFKYKARERRVKMERQQNRDLNMERMRLILKMAYSLKHDDPSTFMHEKKFRNELLS